MESFYQLPTEKQAHCLQDLARKALQYWDIKDAQVSLLKHRENAVFSVIDYDTGERFVLRIHRFAYHSDAALRSELQWMTALAAAGVETPPVISTNTGELFAKVKIDSIPAAHQCDLLGWVDGAPLGSILGNHAADPLHVVQNYRAVGTLAAKLHNQSEHWSRPAGFERVAWDIDGMLGANPVWGRFWEHEHLTLSQKKLVLEAAAIAKRKLEAFGQTPDRYGLIHNDFLPENLLVTADGVRIIDFDDSGFGWHLFEFATSLFFHLGEPYFDDALASMVEGYREVRELPEEHLALLPTFFMVRGLVYLGWTHTRKETETAQAATPSLIESVTAMAEEYTSRST